MTIYDKGSNIEKILKENKQVVIDFYTDWCPPCQVLKPIFKKSSEENKEWEHVFIDVDAFPEISIEWGIKQIPTVISLKDNKEINRIIGVINEDKLKELIK